MCLSIKLIKVVIFWNIPPIFGQSPASNRPFVRFMAFVRNTRRWSLRRSWVDGWKWKVVLIRRHGHGARQRFSTEPEKVWQKFSKMAQESKFTCWDVLSIFFEGEALKCYDVFLCNPFPYHDTSDTSKGSPKWTTLNWLATVGLLRNIGQGHSITYI